MNQKIDLSNPIHLDPDQLKNLEEIIDGLKKDIIVPQRRSGTESTEVENKQHDSLSVQINASAREYVDFSYGTNSGAMADSFA